MVFQHKPRQATRSSVWRGQKHWTHPIWIRIAMWICRKNCYYDPTRWVKTEIRRIQANDAKLFHAEGAGEQIFGQWGQTATGVKDGNNQQWEQRPAIRHQRTPVIIETTWTNFIRIRTADQQPEPARELFYLWKIHGQSGYCLYCGQVQKPQWRLWCYYRWGQSRVLSRWPKRGFLRWWHLIELILCNIY